MKYSFMSFSTPGMHLPEMLSFAWKVGYDGIEPRCEAGHAHGVELEADAGARRAIGTRAVDTGTALCCLATSCRFADPATAAANVERAHRFIDLAGDVGAPRLRVFGGALGKNLDRDAACELLADCLGQLAAHAAERGVTVCVETHDDWCDPRHLARVMTQVNHPAIAVNWDIMHPVRTAGWRMEAAYSALQPWVRHVHVHDGNLDPQNLVLLPIGEGDIDHCAAICRLTCDDYQGYVSGEWINWSPAAEHLPRELAAMRAFEAACRAHPNRCACE